MKILIATLFSSAMLNLTNVEARPTNPYYAQNDGTSRGFDSGGERGQESTLIRMTDGAFTMPKFEVQENANFMKVLAKDRTNKLLDAMNPTQLTSSQLFQHMPNDLPNNVQRMLPRVALESSTQGTFGMPRVAGNTAVLRPIKNSLSLHENEQNTARSPQVHAAAASASSEAGSRTTSLGDESAYSNSFSEAMPASGIVRYFKDQAGRIFVVSNDPLGLPMLADFLNHNQNAFNNSELGLITEVPQAVPQAIPQAVPQAIPQEIPQPIPQEIPQPIPQEIPQPIPQLIPQEIPQPIPQAVPQPLPQAVPQQVPQPISQTAPQLPPVAVPKLPQQTPRPIPQQVPPQTGTNPGSPQAQPFQVPKPLPNKVPTKIPQAVPPKQPTQKIPQPQNVSQIPTPNPTPFLVPNKEQQTPFPRPSKQSTPQPISQSTPTPIITNENRVN